MQCLRIVSLFRLFQTEQSPERIQNEQNDWHRSHLHVDAEAVKTPFAACRNTGADGVSRSKQKRQNRLVLSGCQNGMLIEDRSPIRIETAAVSMTDSTTPIGKHILAWCIRTVKAKRVKCTYNFCQKCTVFASAIQQLRQTACGTRRRSCGFARGRLRACALRGSGEMTKAARETRAAFAERC